MRKRTTDADNDRWSVWNAVFTVGGVFLAGTAMDLYRALNNLHTRMTLFENLTVTFTGLAFGLIALQWFKKTRR